MTAHAAEFFTLDEVNRLKIIQDVVDRRLTTQMAAQRLGISDRQCRRLLSRYHESGPLGMANRRRGKPSNHQLPDGLARYALNIIRERYADFGPTLACEKLAELHDVHLFKETVRSLMVKVGLWIPRKQRAPKIQQPRYRRACCGELIQIDGCDHHWFENRAPACTALVYVDDATSRLMQLLFVKSESTFTYFEATRRYLQRHGKPLALYSDKASVFRINNKNATGGDGYTQFGRAMHELNIQTICANTSSAKGRVERAHLTLQDRLVKELRLRGISSVDAAKDFADEFMVEWIALLSEKYNLNAIWFSLDSEHAKKMTDLSASELPQNCFHIYLLPDSIQKKRITFNSVNRGLGWIQIIPGYYIQHSENKLLLMTEISTTDPHDKSICLSKVINWLRRKIKSSEFSGVTGRNSITGRTSEYKNILYTSKAKVLHFDNTTWKKDISFNSEFIPKL